MTCNDCEEAQNIGTAMYFYRIENANVAIIACKKHAKIMIDRLNASARREEELEAMGFEAQREEVI